ncbi:FG-GAP-like repeat-containing protein [Cellulomonas sp. P24]|uniref:FG-GAP-like repeat-containing protein n=1 Tax=Cellulomonas sp. P24 TaxID=2885206 RepID=UPI00216AF0CA|nr:FG-GAP-like repeat-containing protein [Cellulomonas sp. P24]MCR6491766.1 FG-GAP-like repeat-containing protein [Cellulomonas sp. P24]
MRVRPPSRHARRSRIGLVAVLGLAAPMVAAVGTAAPVQAVTSGFTEVGSPFAVAPLFTPGLPLPNGEVWSSAAVGDVTGDGNPDIIIGGGLSKTLRVYSTSGALEAQVDVDSPSTAYGSGEIEASPALADINGDGVLDVTVATTSNTVAAYSFKGGAVTQLLKWQDPPRVSPGPVGMIATPALGNLNGDATPDVVTASLGQLLDARSGAGGGELQGWPKWLMDTIWSSPAIGDIDGNGVNDVVVGADCEGNTIGTQPCGTQGGGFVWAFNTDGSEKWRYFLPGQTIWSSPALDDLNGDGAQDVVVGSGGYWPEPAGRVVTAINGRTGKALWTAPTPGRVVGSPSLADVTGDGRPDVFVVTYGGYLMGFDGSNGSQLWPAKCLTDSGGCTNPAIGTKSGVALADVDGDGRIEAITQGEQHLRIYDAATGTLKQTLRSSYSGTILAPGNTPTIAQIGGQTWIIQPVRGISSSGADQLVVTVWRSNSALGAAPWPTFKANSQRTGAAPMPTSIKLEAVVKALYQDVLGRGVDPGGLSTWTSTLAGGMSTPQLATVLATSREYAQETVVRDYQQVLGRAPDPGGMSTWTAALMNGAVRSEDLKVMLFSSPEFVAKSGGDGRVVRDGVVPGGAGA